MSLRVNSQELLADVSRETLERLEQYEALVRKWNPKINLVSKTTLDDFRHRHVTDSVQIVSLAGEVTNWADFGSGGGMPGLVAAIILAEKQPGARVTLVESDKRKAAFLRVASQELGIQTQIVSRRIEDSPNLNADVISARALAPLAKLLDYAQLHLAEDGLCLFLKGENYEQEIAESLESWRFQSEVLPSQTNPSAVILRIKDIRRV